MTPRILTFQVKEVQQLKGLPKLIILDLSGNPLCETADYRAYTVFQLRKLKVRPR